jgi:hypothetical protein
MFSCAPKRAIHGTSAIGDRKAPPAAAGESRVYAGQRVAIALSLKRSAQSTARDMRHA